MCNHAVSLANEDMSVHLVGYGGSSLNEEVKSHANITVNNMTPYPSLLQNCLPRFVTLLLKVCWQVITMVCALPFMSGPEFLLLQNPPTIPTLVVGYIYALFHPHTKLVLDWHNYGYSILELSLGGRHPLVKLSRWIEGLFGPRVHAAFCVSKAMKRDLAARWSVDATVLYDKPRESFRPVTEEEKHDLFLRLGTDYPELDSQDGQAGTRFTEDAPGGSRLKLSRPGLLVSGTSWTPDEDFGILFDALGLYEERCKRRRDAASLPDLVCVITGKGPLKDYYKRRVADQSWEHVDVVMPWLEPEDYPKMLAAADLGVCLHASSSGVDLPMKVVDMFGCGLPVAAKNFPALPELVKDGINGLLFDSSSELADRIGQWFEDFPGVAYERRRRPFSSHLDRFRMTRWADHWRAVALPVFRDLHL